MDRESLVSALCNFIALGCADGAQTTKTRERLATEIYVYQRSYPPLNKWWADQNEDATGQGILPVPTTLFKDTTLFNPAPHQASICFHSSGTTRGSTSHHWMLDDRLYRAAIVPPFKHWCLPEGADNFDGLFHVLAPRTLDTNSSLEYMWTVLSEEIAPQRWRFHARGQTPDLDTLITALTEDAAAQRPSFVLGTALALELLIARIAQQIDIKLAPGSRVFETGGFKARRRDQALPKLRADLCKYMGLEPHSIVTEYGMTELSSQAYSGELRAHFTGQNMPTPGTLFCPPWLRVHQRDGLLAFVDLANLDSCAFLLTGDEGSTAPAGDHFILHGRAPGAGLRGCSLRTERLLTPAPPTSSSHSPTTQPIPDSALQSMRAAAADWRKTPLEERCRRVSEAFEKLIDLPALTEGLANTRGGAKAARRYFAETINAIEAQRLEGAVRSAIKLGAPPELVLQIAAGTVFTAFLHPLALCLAAGSSMLWKPSTDEPAPFAEELSASLNHSLGFNLTSVRRWPGGDQQLEEALFNSIDALIVQGDDGTIHSIKERAPKQLPRLLYGHRFSIAILHRDDPPTGPDATGLAHDVLSYDGFGCLSPRITWLLDADHTQLEDWADSFAHGPWAQRLLEPGLMTELLPGEGFELMAYRARAAATHHIAGPITAPLGIGDLGRAPAGPCMSISALAAKDLIEEDFCSKMLGREATKIQGIAVSSRALSRLNQIGGLHFPGASPLGLIAPPGRLQQPPVDWNHDGLHPLRSLFS